MVANKNVSVNEFRDKFLSLYTRKFGNVAKKFIISKYKLVENTEEKKCDAIKNDKKIIIKASRVQKKNPLKTDDNIISNIMLNSSDIYLKTSDIADENFVCNIQQIKPNFFDDLYYCLFFYNAIEIFKISKNEILKAAEVNYCTKQHKGNIGEGQFHINNENYENHKKRYFKCSVTYNDLVDLLDKYK